VLADFIALMIEAVHTSEKFVCFYETIQLNIEEGSHLNRPSSIGDTDC
jgi:hypothetical protein